MSDGCYVSARDQRSLLTSLTYAIYKLSDEGVRAPSSQILRRQMVAIKKGGLLRRKNCHTVWIAAWSRHDIDQHLIRLQDLHRQRTILSKQNCELLKQQACHMTDIVISCMRFDRVVHQTVLGCKRPALDYEISAWTLCHSKSAPMPYFCK